MHNDDSTTRFPPSSTELFENTSNGHIVQEEVQVEFKPDLSA